MTYIRNMWRTVGHDTAVSLLQRSLRGDRLSHAYLFVGPPHVGKRTLALELAQAVNCLDSERPCGQCSQCLRIAKNQHPDVQIVALIPQEEGVRERMRTEIAIDQVREIQRVASLKPFEGKNRVFIFDGAERLSEEAANCLLKTLEEPPDHVLLILLTSREESLLPTLKSRCQRIEFRPLSVERVAKELEARYSVDHARAQELARQSEGCLGWALAALSDPSVLEERLKRLEGIASVVQGSLEERFAYAAELATLHTRDREAVQEELRLMAGLYRDILLIIQGAEDFTTIGGFSTLSPTIRTLLDVETSSQGITSSIKAIQRTSSYLDQNANPRLALEDLMLTLL
ncbi:MAG: DNA polymerase III subunit delta' [Chloroflexi bacterium]|nr:DNA polymerase III subunit delta' [Chloroflexota bacterium]